MRPPAGLLLCIAAVTLHAADDKVTRGAEVFRTTCAVTYCHGPDGQRGRAPALAGRRFDLPTVGGIVARGIPNTGMPSFAAQLKREDIEAVAAYVISLNATGAAAAEAPGAGAVPAEAEPGRALFSDAGRPASCASCHEVRERGEPVSLALQNLKTARLDNLRAAASPNVSTAQPKGEDPFPALVVEKTPARIRLYDLSSPLPVLRTFAPADVEIASGSPWRHSTATAAYTDTELQSILAYLRWAAR